MSEVSFVQTHCYDAKDFKYETLEQVNGNASLISFEIGTNENTMGDVVVVLSEGEIVFHGIISKVQDGWALAADPKDSLLPATVQ
jgi:hypothetical protein